MSNYDLEEAYLLKIQLFLTFILILGLLISITLTYNQILKYEKKKILYNDELSKKILLTRRLLAIIVALLFLIINVYDKKLKNDNDLPLKGANVQIFASILTLIGAIIVLKADNVENPEL